MNIKARYFCFLLLALGLMGGSRGSLPGSIGEDAPNVSAIPKVRFWANLRTNKVIELKEMLEGGFDPNTKSGEGIYPIHQAIYSDNFEILELLVKHNADLNAKDDKGYTSLMLGALLGKIEAVQKLSQQQVNLNSQDNLGATALIHSVQNNRFIITKILLQEGADTDIADYSGRKAEFYAKRARNPAIKDLF